MKVYEEKLCPVLNKKIMESIAALLENNGQVGISVLCSDWNFVGSKTHNFILD